MSDRRYTRYDFDDREYADYNNYKAFSRKRRRRKALRFRIVLQLLFFALAIPFLEILLRAADASTSFFGLGLWRSVFAGAGVGMLLLLIGTLIPKKEISSVVVGILLFVITAFFIAERCCRAFFGVYYQIAYMFSMSGQVAGEFMGTVGNVVLKNLWFFVLALIPFVIFVVLHKVMFPDYAQFRSSRIMRMVMLLVLFWGMTIILCRVGDDVSYLTTDYTANSTVPRFGLVNTVRTELAMAISGDSGSVLVYEPLDGTGTSDSSGTGTNSNSSGTNTNSGSSGTSNGDETNSDGANTVSGTEDAEENSEPAVVYDYNVMDIDFDSLIASDTSDTLLAMDQYFSEQEPTQQNKYTGMFEGKNLIFFTAEAFSGVIIDEELTPALYELANNGFVFTNYYQPDWTQSTTGGEFANMTGLIPTWVGSKTSFAMSVGNSMPFALGWQFADLGYTVTAWHNNTYTYYGRSETHPNLGYNYYGIGNGLEIDSADLWPASDLEMLQATIEDDIKEYVENGTLFHTYYMTVSGHCDYTFSLNSMSKKNQDAVANIDASEQVQAYIACQLELEYALEYLLELLDEYDVADDTVIVLGADHYPYALAEGSTDYYNELTGNNDSEQYTSRYVNTLILWSGCMDEPVVVDTPCSAIDIIPTISNLFGLEYDSRLLSGRDILAPDAEAGEVSTAMHIVLFADSGYGSSWITAAGTYEAYTRTFTPNEGVEVSDDYVSLVNKIVSDRYTYAKYIIQEDYYSHVLP